jgi:chromosome segregation ATPase
MGWPELILRDAFGGRTDGADLGEEFKGLENILRPSIPPSHDEPTLETRDALKDALNLLERAAETIERYQEREIQMEGQAQAVVHRAREEIKAAEAKAASAEARAFEAEARAQSAERRAEDAEEWLSRLQQSITAAFADRLGTTKKDHGSRLVA